MIVCPVEPNNPFSLCSRLPNLQAHGKTDDLSVLSLLSRELSPQRQVLADGGKRVLSVLSLLSRELKRALLSA